MEAEFGLGAKAVSYDYEKQLKVRSSRAGPVPITPSSAPTVEESSRSGFAETDRTWPKQGGAESHRQRCLAGAI